MEPLLEICRLYMFVNSCAIKIFDTHHPTNIEIICIYCPVIWWFTVSDHSLLIYRHNLILHLLLREYLLLLQNSLTMEILKIGLPDHLYSLAFSIGSPHHLSQNFQIMKAKQSQEWEILSHWLWMQIFLRNRWRYYLRLRQSKKRLSCFLKTSYVLAQNQECHVCTHSTLTIHNA